MSITSSQELETAISLAIKGDERILFDIGKFITYNYYINTHIKAGSNEDLENEKIYTQFQKNHPELYRKVEEWVDYNFKKIETGE